MNISVEMIADLIINIVSVIVLFLVVRKLAYNPVKKFMAARTQRVMDEKKQADEALARANKKEKKYDELLNNSAAAEREAIIRGEEAARQEAEKIIHSAQEKAASILHTAEKKAEEKYKKTVEDAENEIVELSMEAAAKLLAREITDDDNKKIVNDFLQSLGV